MVKRIIRSLRLKEISAVDVPAQQGARAVLFKRHEQPGRDHLRKLAANAADIVAKAEYTGARTFNQIFDMRDAEEERWQAQEELWSAYSSLQEAVNSIVTDETLDRAEKLRRIDESLDQFYAAIAEKLTEIGADLSKINLSADIAQLEKSMDPKELKELQDKAAKADALEEENSKLKAAAGRTEKIGKLTPDARKHFDSLEGDEADAFLAKSADEQADIIRKAAESDETIEVNGRVVHKSKVGEDVFEAMKAQKAENDATRAELAKSREEAEDTKFKSMAQSAKYARLPGTVEEKAKALRAIHAIEDEDARKQALAMFEAGAEALGKQLAVVGEDGELIPADETGDLATAEKALNDKADELMAKDNKLTKAQAFDRACQENPKLYKAYNVAHSQRAAKAAAAGAA